jgi:hypothetical protein
MSIRLDMEKWKRRFFACLVLATVALFLTGAREVRQDLRREEAGLRDWARAILAEDDTGPAPAAPDPVTAAVLVRSCSRPVRTASETDGTQNP